MADKDIDFVDGVTVVPAEWLDAEQEIRAAAAWNCVLEVASGTSVRLKDPTGNPANPDGTSGPRGGMAINGRACILTAAKTATLSGGAGMRYLYATNNDSDRDITLVAQTTTAAPVAANWRYVGKVDWNGTTIIAGTLESYLPAMAQSPALTGTPTTVSPALSDDSKQIPNTEWVRDVVGSGAVNGVQKHTATASISASAGRINTFVGASGQTITLPPAVEGTDLDVYNIDSTDSFVISRAGSDVIASFGVNVNSFTAMAGSKFRFVCHAAGVWSVVQLGVIKCSSLPATAFEGMEILYQNSVMAAASNWQAWRLVYTSAEATYKWVYAGGGTLSGKDGTTGYFTAPGSAAVSGFTNLRPTAFPVTGVFEAEAGWQDFLVLGTSNNAQATLNFGNYSSMVGNFPSPSAGKIGHNGNNDFRSGAFGRSDITVTSWSGVPYSGGAQGSVLGGSAANHLIQKIFWEMTPVKII